MPTKPTEPITMKLTQSTDQELDELVGQLKKLKFSAVELARMVALMPFLDRIR